ncbi:MAG TPA: hypothetical protein VGR84_18680 [Candidatus Acidoferrales bacterium]|nr:hypothetical protein [Candidatus Acidoferrales bacterium]
MSRLTLTVGWCKHGVHVEFAEKGATVTYHLPAGAAEEMAKLLTDAATHVKAGDTPQDFETIGRA